MSIQSEEEDLADKIQRTAEAKLSPVFGVGTSNANEFIVSDSNQDASPEEFQSETQISETPQNLIFDDLQPSLPNAKSKSDPVKTPFTLTLNEVDGFQEWHVTQNRGSITDGANGPALNLSTVAWDTPTVIAASKWIVLEIPIISGLVDGANCSLVAVDAANNKEISVAGDPEEQDKIRLRIGEIVFTPATEDVPASVTAYQAVSDSQIIINVFMNGKQYKGIASHSSQ